MKRGWIGWPAGVVPVLLGLVLLLAWDGGGLDLPLARLAGSAQGFAWRDSAALVFWLHAVPRWISSAGLLALFAGALRPWDWQRGWPARDRWQLVGAIALAMVSVTVIKRLSASSCPWDMAEFGGVAQYVSHWVWGVRDGGSGHCFPAGHASAAFGYVAGWFVLRRRVPRLAAPWLAAAMALGLVLGLAQQLRGAHFMSHTLWSAWVCWCVGLAWEAIAQRGACSRASAAAATKLNRS